MKEYKEENLKEGKKNVATTITIVIGILGFMFVMLGLFSESIGNVFRIIFISIGVPLMAVPPFLYKRIMDKEAVGKFLKMLMLIEDIVEREILHKLSVMYYYAFGFMKILFGIFTNSYFFIVSAFYSICFGIAKNVYLRGVKKSNGDISQDYKYYKKVGMLITLGGLVFSVYMCRLFFVPKQYDYGMIVGIAVAVMSFAELIIAIVNLTKSKNLMSSAVRNISLASSFLAMAFTQVALTSFSDANPSFGNALSGVVFGGGAMLIGIIMIYKAIRHKKRLATESSNS